MATIRLTPSTTAVSNSNYASSANVNNMYTNTDSTNYGTFTHNRASTNNAYYGYIRGFNFDDVPSNAVVNSFTVKIKASATGHTTSTSSSYYMSLINGTTQIGSTSASGRLSTTTTTFTFANGSLTWSQVVGYGANFGIRIPLRRANSNTADVVSVYGAEILVDYTIPVYHNVTISGNNVSPTGTQSVLEGDSITIRCSDSAKPTVTDNNVNVTSQLTQMQETGESYTVTNVTTTYGFALNNNDYYESNNKAHASSAAVCRVDFHLPVAATITFSLINYAESTYDYGLLSEIDKTLNTNASADTSNVYWDGKNNNSSSVQTVTYTMSSGDHYIYVKYFKDTYTDSNNDSLQFKVAISLNESVTPVTYWVYTLNNVTADHTIIFSSGASASLPIRVKQNGTWVTAKKLFVRQNGSWVQSSTVKVKNNGTWK